MKHNNCSVSGGRACILLLKMIRHICDTQNAFKHFHVHENYMNLHFEDHHIEIIFMLKLFRIGYLEWVEHGFKLLQPFE